MAHKHACVFDGLLLPATELGQKIVHLEKQLAQQQRAAERAAEAHKKEIATLQQDKEKLQDQVIQHRLQHQHKL